MMPPVAVAADDEAVATEAAAPAVSQTVRAQLRLRELILGGELKAGSRIAELTLVERLAVSRTPVRMALVKLAEEGLLEALPAGGYAVKDFSEADIHDAIEVRGTLEGLGARLAAERGVSPVLLAEADACLERIDDALAQPALSDDTFAVYVQQNKRFHELLAEMAGSPLVARQIERAVTLPFASPNGFVMAQAIGPRARDVLLIAQEQHRAVLDAIRCREGARAEGLMREHARIARRNLQQALRDHKSMTLVPGASLIRRSSAR
jgi:GntR family transcriptional regulator of vanillate catabolism